MMTIDNAHKHRKVVDGEAMIGSARTAERVPEYPEKESFFIQALSRIDGQGEK